MTKSITPNDILGLADYTNELPLFIAAYTLTETVECNVPEKIVLEWAKHSGKLFNYSVDEGGEPIELRDYLFSNYDQNAALELLNFCITFHPQLIK